MEMREMQFLVHELAKEKGWYDGVYPTVDWILSRLMLKVSELAEAAEEVRKPGFESVRVYKSAGGKPEGFGVELADCVIRIMDTCEFLGIDLEGMILLKHDYNKSRPYKHGKTA